MNEYDTLIDALEGFDVNCDAYKRLVHLNNTREIIGVQACNKPTRKGFYYKFAASGLSPKQLFFVGNDEHGTKIVEDLGN